MSRSEKIDAVQAIKQRASGADKSAFVERLQLIMAQWPSADRLARATGVSPSAFRKWLKGEAEPSRERLVALARVAGVGTAWLAEGEGPAPVFQNGNGRRRGIGHMVAESQPWSQFVVPMPQGGVSPVVPDPPPGGPALIAISRDWLRSMGQLEPDRLILDVAVGESMHPTIRDGAALLADGGDRVLRERGIYLLNVNGERMVRRVQRRHDGALVLLSDNAAYLPEVVDKTHAQHVDVIGRVIWVGGPV